MKKIIWIILISIILMSCSVSKDYSERKGYMLLDVRELPRNAKMNSKKYRHKMKKTYKNFNKRNKKTYRRSK